MTTCKACGRHVGVGIEKRQVDDVGILAAFGDEIAAERLDRLVLKSLRTVGGKVRI